MQASRAVRFVAFVAAALCAAAASAATPALVVDVDSGKVLYAERATDPWYPASITKLMTAYVALTAVREGRVSLDKPLVISDLAHAMPPSKMGFPPGIEITLDNALKIIMVKSANDISVAIAEGVGGSVEGFAAMMNAAAQRLGMRESQFVNPHGLPDERQYTSARDMAVLGRALLRDLPEYAGYFRIGAIKFGRRIMNNHNGLMGRYEGTDGMKTGFICASGFNVVASATRNGRRIITVVMGSPSAAERTVRAAALFDHGFSSWGWGAQTLEQLPPSAAAGPVNMRPYICERRGPMPGEDDTPASASADGENGRTQMPNGALAFASIGSTPGARPQLGPRARFEPIVVWTGRTPPSTAVAAQDDDKESARPAGAKLKQKRLARAAKPATVPPAAQAFAATEPKSIINEPGEKPKPVQPAAALTPKPAAPAKPKTAAVSPPTAKPAPPSRPAVAARAATADPAGGKPAPAATAKPKSAPKPQAKASEAKKVQAAGVAKAKQTSEAKPRIE
jgi:D-alanyl-D-alanine carboxypeptidase